MTLTTYEELKILASSDNTNELTRRLARECLANREAQPVGYIDPDSLKEYRGQRAGGIWSAVQRTTSGLNMTTPIYTAQPAPDNARPVAWEMRYWNSGHNMWHDWERITAEQHAEMSVQHAADNVREALTLALQAMEFMGDTLNNIDAVCTEDVEYVTPAFNSVRELLAAAPEGGNDHDTRR